MTYQDFFKGKTITLMGLGLLGRGVGDAQFLAKYAEHLVITDLKPKEILQPSIDQLSDYKNISFVLGEHREEDFINCDMVIKAAGVPLDSPYIDAARNHNVPVYMSSALFAYLSGIKIVGITGTRGKSTTTQLIYEVLSQCHPRGLGSNQDTNIEDLKSERQSRSHMDPVRANPASLTSYAGCQRDDGVFVHLGGNVRGVSTLALLEKVESDDIAVLELDSWQLQGFRDLKISPHIAVFTNFMRDHMNYYKDDLDLYFKDKAAIFEYQTEDDFLVIGGNLEGKIKLLSPLASMVVAHDIPEDWNLKIPGHHNRENAACALEVLHCLGIHKHNIKPVFESYEGLDGRLNLIADINGVKIYNDSNSTTPEALISALQSFNSGEVLLIAGGTDKNLDLSALVQEIESRCKKYVFLEGNGTQRLLTYLQDVSIFSSLQEAFMDIIKDVKLGDIVLFSPGFTSFGLFQNEYDRSDQFKDIVKNYVEQQTD